MHGEDAGLGLRVLRDDALVRPDRRLARRPPAPATDVLYLGILLLRRRRVLRVRTRPHQQRRAQGQSELSHPSLQEDRGYITRSDPGG